MIDGAAPFSEELFDWSKKDILNFVEDNSDNDFIHIKYTWKQLKLTDKWYEGEKRALANDLLKVKREIDLEWTKSSDNSVFSEITLDKVFGALNEPISNLYLNIEKDEKDQGDFDKQVYAVKMYGILDPEKIYFVGVDVAGGTGRDPSAFVIMDPDDLKIKGIFKNKNISTS